MGLNVALISSYELGRQPFGLASPAAWLRARGHQVTCVDLACDPLPPDLADTARLIAFHLPMHTATRLAVKAIAKIRGRNAHAHICCYGLYAPMNELHLRQLGVQTILGGEFEEPLADLADRLENGTAGAAPQPLISLGRQNFMVPDRSGLPPLSRYASLLGAGLPKRAGYTEASRGCKHLCRHCPVVPVYNGHFRIIQKDVVLQDIRQQVMAGAEHITFGDPDFFNGVGHAIPIVERLHAEHPGLTYDVTIKIEHLLKHREFLPLLRKTGCLFVTSAVESIDDAVLEKLAKGHTCSDFLEAVRITRQVGLTLAPTFVTFTPWTTWAGYRELLRLLVDLDLVENVASIQLAMRLLIPAGSRLLDLPEVLEIVGPFDAEGLSYKWKHTDEGLDRLCGSIQNVIKHEGRRNASRAQVFGKIWQLAHDGPLPVDFHLASRATIPYLNEPWFC